MSFLGVLRRGKFVGVHGFVSFLAGKRSVVLGYALAAVVAVALLSLTSCGSRASVHEAVVVRVGSAAITAGAVERWMRALAPDGVYPLPPRYEACAARRRELEPGGLLTELEQECARERSALMREATELLVFSHWLAEEALRVGIGGPASEVSREVRRESAGYAPGPTRAELRSVASASLTAGALELRALRAAPPVDAAQIAAFYRRHISRFERPGERYIDIAEQFSTSAAASRFKKEVEAGRSISSGKLMYREVFKPSDIATATALERGVLKDVFAAPLGVPVGPERINEYSIFVVTKIVPSTVEPLRRVAGAIGRELRRKSQHDALARLIAEWRARWRPRTRCRPGYVVWQCHGQAREGGTRASWLLRQLADTNKDAA